MHNRLIVRRCDLHGCMLRAGCSTADQQWNGETLFLHRTSHNDHFFQ